MDDALIIATLTHHLDADRANRVRLLTDPVRMDNVAADLAYDDPALRNALRSLADLRVERTFLGLHRPTREVLDELAQRLSHHQGIRDDTARRCVWLIDSAYFGGRDAAGSGPVPVTPAGMPPPPPSAPPHPSAPPAPAVPTPAPPRPPSGGPPPPRHTPNTPPGPGPYQPAAVVAGPPQPPPGPYAPPRTPAPAPAPMPTMPVPPPTRVPGPAPVGLAGGPPTRPVWRRPPVLVGGGVAALAVVGILAVALSRGPSLAPVGGLTADIVSAPGSVVLSWQPVSGAGEYEVCRDGGHCEKVSVTKFTDTPGDQSTHTYTVQPRAGSSRGVAATVAVAAANGTDLTAAEQALVAVLSDELVNKRTCKRVSTQASAGITCEAPSSASSLGPSTFWVLQFDTRDAMEQVFTTDTPGTTTPSCPQSTSTTWSSASDPGVDVGNIACYRTTSDNKAVIAWTYWNRKMILYGVSKSGDVDGVYTWWKSAPIPSA